MDRIPSSPPVIPPRADTHSKPLWSVMIPVYNCSVYIPDVIESVLAQDAGEKYMQIEVVDDASTDADVEAIVKSIGKGRVLYYRQPKNVGSLRNFETCLNRARGELVHLLHGDDRVKQGFYSKMAALLQEHPKAGAAFCRYTSIDEHGNALFNSDVEQAEGVLENALYKIAEKQRIQYVAMVVRRKVYEALGSFFGMTYGEDWEMWVRIAKHYPVAYTPEILAEYRKHMGSISWPKTNDGQITRDLTNVIYHIQQHLPDSEKAATTRAKKDCALFCLTKANVIWSETQNKAMAKAQVKLALSLDNSLKLYYHILKFYIKLAFRIY